MVKRCITSVTIQPVLVRSCDLHVCQNLAGAFCSRAHAIRNSDPAEIISGESQAGHSGKQGSDALDSIAVADFILRHSLMPSIDSSKLRFGLNPEYAGQVTLHDGKQRII